MTVYSYFGLSAMFEDGLKVLCEKDETGQVKGITNPTRAFTLKTTWQEDTPDREIDLVVQLSPKVLKDEARLIFTVASIHEEMPPGHDERPN